MSSAATPMPPAPRWAIGDAAKRSGISVKMIRHYESIGLLPAADRSLSNYRLYRDSDIHRLRFIHRARRLGFTLDRIRSLLALLDDPLRPSGEVKRLTAEHVDELVRRVADLQAMIRTLQHLGHHCHGDARPDCPILDELAGD